MVNATNVEDDKFLSRILLISKESAFATDNVENPPSRINTYYGGVSAGVPFLWESKPGTPKHSSSLVDTTSSSLFPPLNPPPCYSMRNAPQSPMKKRTKSLAFRSLFSRTLPNFINKKKSQCNDYVPEATSSSSSSSASSAPSSPRAITVLRRSRSTSVGHKSMFDCEFYDDEKASTISRGSSACSGRCFGTK